MKHCRIPARPSWLAARALAVLLAGLGAPVRSAPAATGNVNPAAIEIDQSANLHPASNPCRITGFVNGPVLNPEATLDWVADCDRNADPPSLVDSVATGVKTSPPDQTGAVPTGHWNGVRIVDGVDGADR